MAEKPSIEAPNFGQQDVDTTLGLQITKESVASTAPGGLSDLLTKILLRDFEQSGGDMQDFDLKGLCDNNTDVYGQPGSQLRRQVQLRWAKIKLRNPPAYCRYLKQFNVEQGKITKAELETHRKSKKGTKMADLDDTVNTVSSALSDEEEEGTDDEE
ncbi:hypothetical protein ACA910_012154 [Epithemia clementina (nom. ined.)]